MFFTLKTLFCKHNYEYVDIYSCKHTNQAGDVIEYKAQLWECRRCYKRIVIGDFNNLRKAQQDRIKLWLKHQTDTI